MKTNPSLKNLAFSFFTKCLILILLFGPLSAISQNAIITENALPGNPSTEWDISGAGDLSIQGFSTDISVNKGETVHFKINTDADDYTISIYRLGYYQGNGARLVGTGIVTAALPQIQPAYLYDPVTGLVDCGNWSESAHWDVPATAVSGIYIAKLTRTDNGGASHIAFVVRDDAGSSDLYFQTSDATWQAYNVYGDNSLYVGNTSYPSGHATKVSYNRPFITRNGGGGGGASEDWIFNAEYPMLRWLERNGYDVSYCTNIDADRYGSLILNHKVFLSVGHDEYWSAQQRANVEAARNSGVNLAFFSGNEVYWKTRWEESIDGSGTPYRTLVCYKEGDLGENVCGGKCDPELTTWTGLWRNGCEYTSADGCNPENALTGQISWDGTTTAMEVPYAYKDFRLWRNTAITSLNSGETATLSDGTLGYEWDWEQYHDFYPAGRIRLSETEYNGHTHRLSLYRHNSGALVFGAGTVQWSWGLDGNHDLGGSVEDIRMQQATVNLFADMNVQPGTLQVDLVPASASTDFQAPVSVITSPVNGIVLQNNTQVLITGTASDNVIVAGVEVSVDSGLTWHVALGTANWSYAWTPTVQGPVTILSRGFDDSGNMEIPGAGVTDTVSAPMPVTCPCTIFQPADVPVTELANDGQAVEIGVKFQSLTSGYITALRFYKGAGTTGTHTGHLWSSTGTLLTEELFTGESASGWQEVTLTTPIAIDANTTYIASCHSSSGDYPYTSPFFTTATINGPLKALADGEDGPNGVYAYGSTTVFPTADFQSSNYFVDVVFSESVQPDTIPPVVSLVHPANGSLNVAIGSLIHATLNEQADPSTVNVNTFELHDAFNVLVPSVISYNSGTKTATLDPVSPLAYSSVYTVTVKGGLGYNRVKDIAGNALEADYNWTFTTAGPPPPFTTEGPGGPILVISDPSNPFSRYPVEILLAEGFNEYKAMDITAVNATVLNDYDVVILGDISLSPSQVTLFTDWTTAGGTFIAFRPDAQLSTLMGLTAVPGVLADKYLLVNTSSNVGYGIVGQTIQFHGEADLYTLNGAAAVATLYSGPSTATTYPAVSINEVGTNGGQAVAFTYDLARSIVYTRQGNPEWAAEKRDGEAGPIRSDDQFYPDWIDFDKVAIPQADEQQHLLSNIILKGNMDQQPLPRFWFLPKGLKAAVVMTGDDHGDAGMQPRFDINIAESTPGCSVENWECVRSTGYLYPGSVFTDAMANYYDSLGFEIALHVNTNCDNFSASQYSTFIADQMGVFQTTFPSIPVPSTNRNHCIAWSDWSTTPEVESANGLRFDVNYYYWPNAWMQGLPGMFTGSGMPMRFAKLDGSIIDCYQAPTQMTDESGIALPSFCDALLDKANGPEGYYGVFVTNMHFDVSNHAGSNAIVASAQAHNVPVVSSKQMLDWLDGRNNSSFGAMTWSGNDLAFVVTADSNANNLKGMVPVYANGVQLSAITYNGSSISYTQEMIKGIEYAFFSAPSGSYVATYGITSSLAITNISATPYPNETALITWTTNQPASSVVDYDTSSTLLSQQVNTPALVTNHSKLLTALTPGETYYYRVTSVDASPESLTVPQAPAAPLSFTMPAAYCAQDITASDFLLGTMDTSILISTVGDGEISLLPNLNEEFNAMAVPPGWADEIWDGQAGAITTYTGDDVIVNGTHLYTSSTFSPGQSIEFEATYSSGNFQNIGFTADGAFNNPWAVIGRGALGDGNLYARTSDNQTAVLGTGLLDNPHVYKIQWNAGTNNFAFYVDGVLIPTPGIVLTNSAPMIAHISDYPAGGPGLAVNWLKVLPFDPAGDFHSQIFDQGDTTNWEMVTWTDSIPAGTNITVQARGGNTSVPDGSWTAFQPLTNGANVGIVSRYLQYKATLSSADPMSTPYLMDISFGCSSSPDSCITPVAYISAVDSIVCMGGSVAVKLDSANGQSPYSLLVNGVTYNNVLPGDVFATFTTPASSLWGAGGIPANPNATDAQPIETGVKFQSSVNGFVTGVRFYKGVTNTGTHTGSLWSSDGTLLATATFQSESASGWQEVLFDTPVYVEANTTYIASYFSPDGVFAITTAFFNTTGFSNGTLTALQAGVDGPNGVYAYGGGFPSGGNNANYWVDVLFMEQQTAQTTNYILASITDNNGCSNTGDTLDIVSATVTPLPAGTIAADPVCDGQDIFLTFNANSGTGPFDVVINDSTYTNILNGVPFNTGETAVYANPMSIWDSLTVPATITTADNASIELGVKFKSSVDGKINGIRFYKGPLNTGVHTGSLWSASGALLATATFTSETADGWQQVLFSAPVDIVANTTYVASYHTEVGNYSHNPAYFTTTGFDNGPLHALQEGENGSNGVYVYNSGTSFPTQSFNSSNYWVDVIFTEGTGSFTLSEITDVNGCSSLMAGDGVSIQQPAALSASLSQTDITCKGLADGSAVVTVTGGSGVYTYLWNDLLAQTSDTASGLIAGLYNVQVIDAGGCADTIVATVTIAEPLNDLTLNTIQTNVQCFAGADGQAIVQANGGTGPYSYSWSNSATNDTISLLIAGTYIVSATDANGCMEDDTVVITEPAVIANAVAASICSGSSITVGSNTYTASGVYTDTLSAINGCDSIVTTTLIVNPPVTATDVISACDSYTWIDGITYTADNNTAVYTLTNMAGCDSVVTLNLSISYSNTGTETVSACDSFTWIDGITYTADNNTAVYTLTNMAGCDSVVTLDLTINYSSTGTDIITACDSFIWIDGITYTADNNTAVYTLTNMAGCDSVVTLNLSISYSNTGTETVSACDSFTWIDGITYTADNNTAVYTLTNMAGCDSVVTLDLTVNYSSTGTDIITACGSYTWIDGNTYTTSNNSAVHTATGSTGCDSTVFLDLTINSTIAVTDSIAACGSYTWIDGITYTASNDTSVYILTGTTGCDSVVTLHLEMAYPDAVTDSITTCDSFTWINGITYTESNDTAVYTLMNSAGCDSVITLHLIINAADVNVLVLGNTITAQGTGSHQWVDCNNNYSAIAGATGQSFTPTVNGDYAVILNNGNCTDTSDCITIYTIGTDEIDEQQQVLIYPNPAREAVNITIYNADALAVRLIDLQGNLVYEDHSGEKQSVIPLDDVAAGIYFVHVYTAKGVTTTKISVTK